LIDRLDLISKESDGKRRINNVKFFLTNDQDSTILKRKLTPTEIRTSILEYLNHINYNINLNNMPWTTIHAADFDLYTEIQNGKWGLKTGKGIQFLLSNPNELFKKLDILIAEEDAGNTNILEEASAIVDELRRLGLLTITQVKKIYKLIK